MDEKKPSKATKVKRVYPTTLKPPEQCNPASRMLANVMRRQQRLVVMLGGEPYTDEMITEVFLPTYDRITTYCMPEGLMGDAITVGIPLVQGTVAEIGVRKLLSQGAVIAMNPATHQPGIRLPDGTFIPTVASMQTTQPADDKPPVN